MPVTIIYLAGRYSRREELVACAADLALIMADLEITSRWLRGAHELDTQGLSVQGQETERKRFALEDWDDLMRAHWVINFTEEPRSSNSRGGRHVEFGAALAAGKRCIIVGPRENVFHHLPYVEVYPSWPECLATLILQGAT